MSGCPLCGCRQAGRYGALKLDQQVMARRINWLTSIRDWQSEFVNSLSAREFVDCITDDLLGRGVFVFTPPARSCACPRCGTHLAARSQPVLHLPQGGLHACCMRRPCPHCGHAVHAHRTPVTGEY